MAHNGYRLALVAACVCMTSTARGEATNDARAVSTAPEVIDEVVVSGNRSAGTVLSEIEPELVLTEEDIAAYGVSSIGDLIELLSRESGSGRASNGPPVVLINGRRVSGFREVGRYPVEALARVELLAEQVALSYGFAADQRVLNFVLKPDVTVTSLAGGTDRLSSSAQSTVLLSGQHLRVDGESRSSIDFLSSESDSILETETNLFGRSNTTPRTLAPSTTRRSGGLSATREVGAGSVATITAALEEAKFQTLTNAPQSTRTDTQYFGLTAASPLAPSTWTLTAFHETTDSTSETQLDSGARDTRDHLARSQIGVLLNQRLADFVQGPVTLTASVDWSDEHQQSEVVESNARSELTANRESFRASLSLDVPLALPEGIPSEISVNLNGSYNELSDFGQLTAQGVGVTWRPVEQVRVLLSLQEQDEAPTLTELTSPVILTPGVRVVDTTTGDSALTSVLSGGNSALGAARRRSRRVGVQWMLRDEPRVQLNTDYEHAETTGATRTLTAISSSLESAFPDRVTRTEQGGLNSLDLRPIQTEWALREDIRTTLSVSKRLKATPVRAAGPRPTKRRRSGRPGTVRLILSHRWTLTDQVRLADGQPVLDLLGGDALDRLGGTPEHTADLSLTRWNNGLGLALTGRYQSRTTSAQAPTRLTFSSLLLLNLRMSYEFNYADTVLAQLPFLEETRISFSIDNLLDRKINVLDESDATPVNLQPDILDPFGRTFRFRIRRRF
ncbi:MAG: hypothetical protein AAF578_11585 [Pseudomonadota bacterium]